MAQSKSKGVSAEAAALELAHQRPELGQFRAATELRRQGIAISPSGVRAIWKRHGFATVLQRLSMLSGATAGVELSESQHARLHRARVSHRLLARKGTGIECNGAGRRAQVFAAAAFEF